MLETREGQLGVGKGMKRKKIELKGNRKRK